MATKPNAISAGLVQRPSKYKTFRQRSAIQNSKLDTILEEVSSREKNACPSSASIKTRDGKKVTKLAGWNKALTLDSTRKVKSTNGLNSRSISNISKAKLRRVKGKSQNALKIGSKAEIERMNLRPTKSLNKVKEADLLAKGKALWPHKSTAFLNYLEQIYKNEKENRDIFESSENIINYPHHMSKKNLPGAGGKINSIRSRPCFLQATEESPAYQKQIIHNRYLCANNLSQAMANKKPFVESANLEKKMKKRKLQKDKIDSKPSAKPNSKNISVTKPVITTNLAKIKETNGRQLDKQLKSSTNTVLKEKKTLAVRKSILSKGKGKSQSKKSVEFKKVIQKVIPSSMINTIATQSKDGFLKRPQRPSYMRGIDKAKATTTRSTIKLPSKLSKSALLSSNVKMNDNSSMAKSATTKVKETNVTATANLPKLVKDMKPILDFAVDLKYPKNVSKKSLITANRILNSRHNTELNQLLQNSAFLEHIEYYTREYAKKLKSYLEEGQENKARVNRLRLTKSNTATFKPNNKTVQKKLSKLFNTNRQSNLQLTKINSSPIKHNELACKQGKASGGRSLSRLTRLSKEYIIEDGHKWISPAALLLHSETSIKNNSADSRENLDTNKSNGAISAESRKELVPVCSTSKPVVQFKRSARFADRLNEEEAKKIKLNDEHLRVTAILKTMTEALWNDDVKVFSSQSAFGRNPVVFHVDTSDSTKRAENEKEEEKASADCSESQAKLDNEKDVKTISSKESRLKKSTSRIVNMKANARVSRVGNKPIAALSKNLTKSFERKKESKLSNDHTDNKPLTLKNRKRPSTAIKKQIITQLKDNKDLTNNKVPLNKDKDKDKKRDKGKDKDKDKDRNKDKERDLKTKQTLAAKKKSIINPTIMKATVKKVDKAKTTSTASTHKTLTHSNNKLYLQKLGAMCIKGKLSKPQAKVIELKFDKNKVQNRPKLSQVGSKVSRAGPSNINVRNTKTFSCFLKEVNDALPSKQSSKNALASVEKTPKSDRSNKSQLSKLVRPKVLSTYLSYDDIMLYLTYLQSTYTQFVNVETIGYSYENRAIKSIIIDMSGNLKQNQASTETLDRQAAANVEGDEETNETSKKVDPPKPMLPRNTIFIEAGTHAREWMTVSTAIHCIYQLTEKRMKLDPSLNNLRFHIIPLLNPDGYEYSRTTNRNWRKNRRPHSNGIHYGTDCNRNFDFHWNCKDVKPNSETYPGEKPFSESETTALANYLNTLSPKLLMFISLHAHGQSIMYPWGYTKALPKNVDTLNLLAKAGKKVVERHSGRQYSIGPIAKITKHLIPGSIVDYVYGVVNVPLVFVIELPSKQLGFQPETCVIKPVCFESWLCIREMCKIGYNLYTTPGSQWQEIE